MLTLLRTKKCIFVEISCDEKTQNTGVNFLEKQQEKKAINNTRCQASWKNLAHA